MNIAFSYSKYEKIDFACVYILISLSRIPSRIDLSEIVFEKRISRRRNTPRHIADRNAFLHRPLSMHVSSDKRKPQRFETVPSGSAVLDFKPSRRVIVIALNLKRRAAKTAVAVVACSSPRKTSFLFFPRGSEAS